MIAEGKLEFEITWNGKRITGAAVNSSRPVFASRVLEGKLVDEAVRRVPFLFGVCGKAQGVAAAAACDAARGIEAASGVRDGRERAIAAECLQEYLWRLFIDLPPLIGEAARPGDLAGLRRRRPVAAGAAEWRDIAADAEALLEERVYGMKPRAWLELDAEKLGRWTDDAALPSTRMLARLRGFRFRSPRGFLPWLGPAELAGVVAPAMEANDAFAAAPTWQGKAAETGALARQRFHPLLADGLAADGGGAATRLLARLVELAALPEQLRRPVASGVRAAAPRRAAGIAAVETARGTLIHRVDLDGVKVAHYRIVAPTEWNFHPRGAFPRGLAGMPARDENEARRAAALLAHALDPCVAYGIRVQHA